MKKLFKISFSGSILGILILLILSIILQPKQLKINNLNKTLLNQKIRTTGTIIKIKSFKTNNFQIIKIKDKNKTIDITLNKILKLQKGDLIEVTGKLKKYKQKLQIQAEKITKITF